MEESFRNRYSFPNVNNPLNIMFRLLSVRKKNTMNSKASDKTTSAYCKNDDHTILSESNFRLIPQFFKPYFQTRIRISFTRQLWQHQHRKKQSLIHSLRFATLTVFIIILIPLISLQENPFCWSITCFFSQSSSCT